MTLREFQNTVKPREEIIYNCSEYIHQNDEWVPFTIGIGYTFIRYNKPIETFQIGTHDNLVLCAFTSTTDSRRRPYGKNRVRILENLSKNRITNIYIPPYQYFNALPSFKFVVSPEGNGIDCHRHYESLMAGCIPIIEYHPGIREKYSGCPVLFTDDYSEITSDYLQTKYDEMIDMEWDFSKLLLSNYSEEEQEMIRDNGNYWGQKLTGKKWY